MTCSILSGHDCTHKSVPLGNSQPTICLRSVSQFHESCCGFSFLITRHLHQVLIVSSTACMCNTSWTAFWLRYRPPDYDGTLTFRHNPVSKSNIKVQSFVHQRISKKLQYIGATIFMAISLGVLSLSYWAQVSNKFLHIQTSMTLIHQHLHLILMTFIFQMSQFEPITLPQVGLVAGSLGLTLGYGMGWYISLAHQYGLAQLMVTDFIQSSRDGLSELCNAW